MALEVDCSSCAGRFRVPDSAAGKKIRCPKCKGAIDVASPAGAASEPVAPSAPAPSPSPVHTPAPAPAPAAAQPASAAAAPAQAAKKAVSTGPAVLKMPSPAARAETIQARTAPATVGNASAQTAAAKPSPAPAAAPQTAVAEAPSAEAPETWWFQAEDGEVYGPVERAELEEWRAEGRISPACQLRSSRNDAWMAPADLFPELAPPADEPAAADEPAEEEPTPARTGKKKAGRKANPAPPEETDGEPLSSRSKAIAFVLAFFLPWTGAHRFYLGYPGLGVAWALTFGGLMVGAWVDAFRILFGNLPDAEGRRLRE